jgi:O-antigen ligase
MEYEAKKEFSDYPYINTFLLVLFCTYVIIWYLQIGYRKPELGEMRFEFIYAACLFVIAIFGGGHVDLKCPLIAYIVLYFIILIIQVPFSYDSERSWDIFVNRIVKFAFMSFFIVAFVKSPRHLKYFLGAFLLACMKLGQEGFVGKITGSMIWENQGVMRLHGVTPIYFHPNSFSGNALGTVPFIYSLWPISNWFVKTAFLFQLVFALNIIVFTGSRTGYVGFLILLIFALYKSKVKKKFLLYGIVFSLISFSLIPQQYVERFETIFTQQDKEGRSIETRRQIFEDAWQIFLSHPFGIGVAAFPAMRRDTFGRTQDTHNIYLEVATNLGIQGFVIFFLLVYKMLKTINTVKNNITVQIEWLKEKLLKGDVAGDAQLEIGGHLKDLRLMEATCSAVYLFVILRLGLGLFGMDLYEIYWWFAFGLSIAIFNMNKVAKSKTKGFLDATPKIAEETKL